MALRLFSSGSSPFARKCLVVLHETGQAGNVEIVGAAGSPIDPGTMPVSLNPLGKIPALERDSGPVIYDSRVICRYFGDNAKSGLYPKGESLYDSLTLEATADGMMDAAILCRYEVTLRPEDKRMPEWIEGQWTKVARALDSLENRWMAHLHGPLDIGQIAVGAALGYLDLRFSDRDWPAGHPSLAAWWGKLSARDSFRVTAPPG